MKVENRVLVHVSRSSCSRIRASRGDLSLCLLGGFELRIGEKIEVLSRPAERLLVFLALYHRRLARSYVSQSLWLDATEAHADGSLRNVLSQIGRVEPSLVDKTGGHVAMGPLVIVDLHRSSSLARTLVASPALDGVVLDERMLSEDLLPDWQEEWILQYQEQYRQLRLHGLEAMCERLISLGRFGQAVQAGLAAVGAEPLREGANLALVKAHFADGNASEGLRHCFSFERQLERELGLGPSPGFRQAIEDLRNQVSVHQRAPAMM